MDPHPEDLADLARDAIASGNLGEADRLCREILDRDPINFRAILMLAVVSARAGSAGRAIQLFKQALDLQQESWDALNWLCVLLRRTGDVAQAVEYGLRALELAPDSAESHANLGLCYLAQWNFVQALECFDRSIECQAVYAPAHHNRGVALQRLGRLREAETAFRRAIELEPASPNSRISLGKLLAQLGGEEEARSLFAQVATSTPQTLNARLGLANSLAQEGLVEQAEKVLLEAADRWPSDAVTLVLLGSAQRQLGHFNDALASFENAIEVDPSMARAYFELVHSRRVEQADRPVIARMEAMLGGPDQSSESARQLHYGLGKALDDLGDYERAFHHFKAANAIMHGQLEGRRFDRDALSALFDRIIRVFTPEFFARYQSSDAAIQQSESASPILIVGMIRSGTTLVEQILSSHPQVGAGGEQQFLLENGAILDQEDRPTQAKTGMVGQNYRHLLRSLAPGKARVTDKMPNNFMMLGLVHLVFPDAKIVHCRRNAADTCLSIYVTPYRDALNFAHHPDDIVFFYRQYARLMDHWRSVLPPSAFFEIDYEAIVSEGEGTVRRLLEFCDLDWNEACLNYHERGGAVLTPSNWQVRQPLYRSSVGRYEHYRQWLPEFADL